jgi:hypothetical protein
MFVSEYLTRIAECLRRQDFSLESIGEAERICIWSRRAPGSGGPVIFVSTGIHGDERSGPEALLQFLENSAFAPGVDWVIAPLLNPSGFRQGTRSNAEGIDLNRDFLRCQCRETKALIDWWRAQERPCRVHLSLHDDWEAEGFYLYEIDTTGFSQSLSAKILAAVERVSPLQSNGPVDGHILAAPGLIIHEPVADEPEGWPEAIWLTRTWPVRSYTFEAPGRLPSEVRVKSLVAALEGALKSLICVS